MNNSIEYIKRRIQEGNTDKMPLNGWDEASISNPIEQYLILLPDLKSCFITDNTFKINLNCDKGKIDITIQYDSNVEYDYFTTISTTHDGTHMFIYEAIEELLYKLFKLETYAKNKATDDFINNPANYDVKYIIGDIIKHSDYGRKNINGHDMFGQTDTIVLPIKFEIIKKS